MLSGLIFVVIFDYIWEFGNLFVGYPVKCLILWMVGTQWGRRCIVVVLTAMISLLELHLTFFALQYCIVNYFLSHRASKGSKVASNHVLKINFLKALPEGQNLSKSHRQSLTEGQCVFVKSANQALISDLPPLDMPNYSHWKKRKQEACSKVIFLKDDAAA